MASALRALVFGLGCAFLGACSSGTPAEVDSEHFAHYQRDRTPMEERTIQGSNNVDPIAVGQALSYLIDSQIDKGKVKANKISGDCAIRPVEDSNINNPCINVPVVLRNDKNEEIERVFTDNGRFAFRVKKGEKYKVVVDLENYRLPKRVMDSVSGGDKVRIELTPKK